MRVIPAIDLKDGQCVRLQKGDYGTAHKVAENPVETAQRFLDAGADLVHMVDLDAAKDGSHANYGVVEQVIRETGATVELGGGIRSMQDVETVLALGVSRVIIGSAAVRDPEFVAEAVKKYGDKIVVGIDAKSETVRTDGWLGDSGENYIAFAERMESIGVRHIIFTDIDKDGMLAGPNFDQLAALRASVSCEIIASGGVSTLEDIAGLKKLGIDGAIAGKAVYTGTLDLEKVAVDGIPRVGVVDQTVLNTGGDHAVGTLLALLITLVIQGTPAKEQDTHGECQHKAEHVEHKGGIKEHGPANTAKRHGPDRQRSRPRGTADYHAAANDFKSIDQQEANEQNCQDTNDIVNANE